MIRQACPSCPDGNEWSSQGPTGRACPTCKGLGYLGQDERTSSRAVPTEAVKDSLTTQTGEDLLTEEECSQLRSAPCSFNAMLQAAARIGAERERERAARALTSADSLAKCVEEFQASINTEAMARECAERDDAGDADHETLETAAENLSEAWKATDRAIHYYRKHAAAIRRGEGG